MAIRTKRIKGANGINYTKELDGPSDWAGILNDTYFKDLSDGLIYWKNLNGTVIAIYEIAGSTGGTGDYGGIIFVSEVGPTGDTRNNVIGKIMSPVSLEWASQIAQSGDTIHVKAGTYNVTTTGQTGLSVDGVNHYFEENARVYKTTTGGLFTKYTSFGINSGGNVYGNGSFYSYGSAGITYYYDGFGSSNTGFTTNFSIPAIFEFDECINTNQSCVFNVNGGDVIIRGKRRIISSASSTITISGNIGEKQMIDCPYIETTAPSSFAINYGQAGGGNSDLIINSNIILGTLYGIATFGSGGRLIAKASYINKINAIGAGGGAHRDVDIKCGRVDELLVLSNILNVEGHVGNLNISGGASKAKIDLCDEFTINNNLISPNSVIDITMSNVTGGTNTFSGNVGGTLNLKSTNLIQSSSKENPISGNTSFTVGPKEYLFNGSFQKINLLGRWDNGDTITHNGVSQSILTIDSNAYIQETTININSEKLEVKGKTYDCQVNYTGGTIVLNGATMVVSDQNKQIITTPFSGSTVKVYSAGLSTNKMDPFNAEQEKLKVNVLTTSPTITIDGENFPIVAGSISLAAAEMVTAINGSGTLAVTATQDNPGSDNYFYIEADVAGTGMVVTYDANVSLNEIVRYNNLGLNDTVGGTVIEDADID